MRRLRRALGRRQRLLCCLSQRLGVGGALGRRLLRRLSQRLRVGDALGRRLLRRLSQRLGVGEALGRRRLCCLSCLLCLPRRGLCCIPCLLCGGLCCLLRLLCSLHCQLLPRRRRDAPRQLLGCSLGRLLGCNQLLRQLEYSSPCLCLVRACFGFATLGGIDLLESRTHLALPGLFLRKRLLSCRFNALVSLLQKRRNSCALPFHCCFIANLDANPSVKTLRDVIRGAPLHHSLSLRSGDALL